MRITESKLRSIIRSVIKEASLPSTNPKELRNTFSYKLLPDDDKKYEKELRNTFNLKLHSDKGYEGDEETFRKKYSDLLKSQEDEADDYSDPIFDPFTQEEIDADNFINSFLEDVVRGINKSCTNLKRKSSGNHFYTSSIEKLKKLKGNCLSLGHDGMSILLTREFPASEEVKTKLEKEIKNNILYKHFPQHPDDVKSARSKIHREIFYKILRSLL